MVLTLRDELAPSKVELPTGWAVAGRFEPAEGDPRTAPPYRNTVLESVGFEEPRPHQYEWAGLDLENDRERIMANLRPID